MSTRRSARLSPVTKKRAAPAEQPAALALEEPEESGSEEESEEEDAPTTRVALQRLKVAELKAKLTKRGLSATGRKEVLAGRAPQPALLA